MSNSQVVVDFTTLAIANGGWMDMDRIYLQNKLIGMIGMDSLDEKIQIKPVNQTTVDLGKKLLAIATENHKVGELPYEQDILMNQIMDVMTPPPSVLNAFFSKHYEHSPKEATTYFYELSKANDYIKTESIAKNIAFSAETEYGIMEITINLSKPEKDPKQIAAEREANSVNYPKCLLCMENEGYLGRINHPARSSHRIIRMNLEGESWGLQYSPYAYYNEHCIFLAGEHRPMKIGRQTFERLVQIVEIFPHYFVGSNADLPIVGGSILSHDHYQGGRHTFAMAQAPIEDGVSLPIFPKVNAGIVKWPMSVIRLQSSDKKSIVDAADYILEQWKNYSDESVQLLAYSEDGVGHHTITPIARMRNGLFELDLVLRDNGVSEEFPSGIFHPHSDVQHIKKENIGLIEVMGLAVLPPRLKTELIEVEKFLLNEENSMESMHLAWAENIKNDTKVITKESVRQTVQQAVGKVFTRVLEDAGVFKRTDEGKKAFRRFIDVL